MRHNYAPQIERGREQVGRYRSKPGERCGRFVFRPQGCRRLCVLVSDEAGWDHVSVSVAQPGRHLPSYHEMKTVKRLFFKPGEWAVEYHPAVDAFTTYGSDLPGEMATEVLHLWRPQRDELPIPPRWMV